MQEDFLTIGAHHKGQGERVANPHTLRGPHSFTFHSAKESDTLEQSRLSSNFKLVSHFWTTVPGARHGLRFLFYKHCNYPVNGTIIFVCVLKVFIC